MDPNDTLSVTNYNSSVKLVIKVWIFMILNKYTQMANTGKEVHLYIVKYIANIPVYDIYEMLKDYNITKILIGNVFLDKRSSHFLDVLPVTFVNFSTENYKTGHVHLSKIYLCTFTTLKTLTWDWRCTKTLYFLTYSHISTPDLFIIIINGK